MRFENAVRIVDGQSPEGLAQAAGGFRDDRRAEIPAEMENLLLLVRFQPAYQNDDSLIEVLAQPAGERGDIEPVLRRSEGAGGFPREIFIAGLEGFLELRVEMDRALAVPVGEVALKRMDSENPRLLDRLGRAGATECGGPVRGQRDQRPRLIERLDHRGQQFGGGGPAGGDHGAGIAGFHVCGRGRKTRRCVPRSAARCGRGPRFPPGRAPRSRRRCARRHRSQTRKRRPAGSVSPHPSPDSMRSPRQC